MPLQAHRAGRPLFATATAILVATAPAWAQDAPVSVLPDIEVIGTTPLAGTGTPIDKVPGNPQTLSEDAIERFPGMQLTDQLDRQMGSVAAVDVQNSTFQKDIRYRGFAASPLLGESQGIAVYQNGVRINEAFGDTVQWDLIPEPAIRNMALVNNNPVFGLNALGGAIAIDMHDGFSFQGVEGEAYGGYWERYGTEVQAGYAGENFGIYVAADHQSDDGWRNNSPSDLSRFYSDVGFQGDIFSVNFNFTYADTDMNGNGLSPTELLDQNRRAVFTWPDNTQNEIFFFQGDGSVDISDTASIQANTYFRRITRSTINGDEVEAAACDAAAVGATFAGDGNLAGTVGNGAAVAAAPAGFLCEEDDEAELLIDQDGNAIPVFASNYAAKNTSSTQTSTFGAAVQGVFENEWLGFENTFIVGTALDFSQTKFHNQQTLAALTLDRGFIEPANPILSLQKYEASLAGGDLEAGGATPTQIKNTSEAIGVYVSDTVDVTDQLTITAAARLNHIQTSTTDNFSYNAERLGNLNGEHSFTDVNPALGFTYNFPSVDTTLYGSFSRNMRAPTPAELGCADPAAPCRFPNAFVADPPLERIVAQTFEAGVRGAVPGLPEDLDINWNVGFYTTTNFDDIIFVSAGTGLAAGYFRNIKRTMRRGMEVGVNGRWGRLGWFANYSLTDAKYGSSFRVTSTNHPQAASSAGGRDIPVENGDDIPGIPDHTFNLGLDYALFDDFVIGSTLVARSGVYLRGDEGNFLPRTDPYAVVNAHAAYSLTDWVEVFARVENLFDTNYETFGVLGETGNEVPIYELPGGVTNPRFLSPGQPFAGYVGVRIRLN
ncbi:MAG: TonB-dependent receptor [Alphaproteobacteria bacterium]|nr:TonB-dependent receptor [Alphaproteobacteria bacterium]